MKPFLTQYRARAADLEPVLRRLLVVWLVALPAASRGSLPLTPLSAPPVAQSQLSNRYPISGPERQLIDTLNAIRSGEVKTAQQQLNQLLARFPRYQLAYLLQGDLLRARTRPLATLGDWPHAPQAALENLRFEAQVRLKRFIEDVPDTLTPRDVLHLAARQRYLLAVDVSRSRLYVYKNKPDGPQRIADFYVAIGKNGDGKQVEGDQKTPLGVYAIVSKLSEENLPEFYGKAAFPIDYPNGWDRSRGHTGHGIWLHGSPEALYSRVPRSSNGCLVLSNHDLTNLSQYLQIGITPIIISHRLAWSTANATRTDTQQLRSTIENWRNAWEARNAVQYIDHYSSTFRKNNTELRRWTAQKTHAIVEKKWIKVHLDHISLLRHPEKPNLVVASFEQDYQSNLLKQRDTKKQYWAKEASGWKIVFEETH